MDTDGKGKLFSCKKASKSSNQSQIATMLKPFLYALYKQGRFRRPGSETTDEGMQQIERFAVASLALVLRHEASFRKDFLCQVCGCSKKINEGEFLVEIEIAGCGDLALRKKDNSEVYMFEFKVGSPIQPNQDPRNGEFFTSGYGAGIKAKPWKKSTFILVQNDPTDLSNAVEKIPVCVGKSWRDIRNCTHKRPLIHDLFESLGSLNIPEFIYMNTRNMSLGYGGATLAAVRYHELLAAVARCIGSRTTKLDVNLEPGRENGHIGMKFSPKDYEDKWQDLVQPKKEIGWFGYCQDGEASTLDIWFYCGNERAATRIHQILEKGFSNAKVTTDEENNVRISLIAEKSADNQRWFVSVFESLVQRK
jgi:hypothetical protein